jgi:hypothetical protein
LLHMCINPRRGGSALGLPLTLACSHAFCNAGCHPAGAGWAVRQLRARDQRGADVAVAHGGLGARAAHRARRLRRGGLARGGRAADAGACRCCASAAMPRAGSTLSLALRCSSSERAPPPYTQADASTRARVHDPWEWWNAFRSACDGHASLGAVIDIGASLPPDEDWRRWIGEPLKCARFARTA